MMDLTTPTIVLSYEETPQERADRLENENAALKIELAVEKKNRFVAEQLAESLRQELESFKQREERKAKRKQKAVSEYTELKSDGKTKAHAAESIRSYDDFKAIQDYFLRRGKVRDWMMWTIGVSLGLRVSDLLNLKFKSFFNDNMSFRKRIQLIEQKTSKANKCLITDSVKDALIKYLDSIQWKFSLDDYIFESAKTHTRIKEEYGWKILSDAAKALALPFVVGSHTMRKSFANIAACVDTSTVDMNAITKVQGLLNHSDQKVTMRYLGTFMDMYDRAREAVSEFVLGRSKVNVLMAGSGNSMDTLVDMLEKIDAKLSSIERVETMED